MSSYEDATNCTTGVPQGYFSQELDVDCLCSECQQVLREPIRLRCTHSYCKICFERLKQQKETTNQDVLCKGRPPQNEGTVPMEVDDEDEGPHFMDFEESYIDRPLIKKIKKLVAVCPNGCNTPNLNVLNIEVHVDRQCELRLVKCSSCGAEVPSRSLDNHMSQCRNLPSTSSVATRDIKERQLCPLGCGALIPFADSEMHRKQCSHRELKCGVCKQYVTYHRRQSHFEDSRCRGTCPLCAMSNIRTRDHFKNNGGDHDKYLVDKILQLEERLEASMADRPMGEQEQLNSLQELLGRYNATLTDVNAKLQDLAPNTDLTKLSRQADRVDQINRLFSETKSQVEILMKDVQKLAGYKMMFETLKQQLNSKMEDIEKKLSNLHQEHLSMEASNLELQRTFDEMQRSSYDGTLIWRIHPFKEKFADAEHGRQLSLYSPPFYSHPYGYKMQARIFLAGDGSGKGTHLSFFFLICKGDYDALLHWPFKLMVNLRILNSRDRSGKNDKVQKFKPDGGVSFQKPTTLMNQATGLPQFIRHEDLMDRGRGFVDENEDALYIAVVVNAEDETARPVVYKKIQ